MFEHEYEQKHDIGVFLMVAAADLRRDFGPGSLHSVMKVTLARLVWQPGNPGFPFAPLRLGVRLLLRRSSIRSHGKAQRRQAILASVGGQRTEESLARRCQLTHLRQGQRAVSRGSLRLGMEELSWQQDDPWTTQRR